MNVEIAKQAATPTPEKSGETAGNSPATHPGAFQQKLGQAGNSAATTQPSNVAAMNHTNAMDPTNRAAQTAPPTKTVDVATTNAANMVTPASIPEQDLFGKFDQIRGEYAAYMKKSEEIDKLVAEEKLKSNDPKVQAANREEMRMLLHFQTEMQGAAVKVEIASKVVDHGTSGAKTILQTQA